MITIEYEAKRELQAGVTSGDIIVLVMPCETFQPDVTIDESVSTAIGGLPQVSLKHYYKTWQIKTLYDDVNTQADYEQFLYSVLGGAPFTITDYDHNNDVKNVIMNGKFSKSPIRRFNAGEFNYSFVVRNI